MIKKTIAYKDFNGNDQFDTFYFNINEAEAIELRFIHGDFQDTIKYLEGVQSSEDEDIQIDANYSRDLWNIFKEILEKSVGQKSADGKLFIKNDEIRAQFTQSNAMSQFLIELLSDTANAVEFVNGVITSSAASSAVTAPAVSEA
jgi:hypothetical protein